MADIYRIGVSIAMQSNGGEVLSALSRSLLGLNVSAKDAERSLNRIQVAAIGLGGVMAGAAILGGMAKLVDAGKEFVHQQSLMLQAGMSHRDLAEATGAAWANAANIMGSSADKNIALIVDLRNQLGSMNEAVATAPAMTRMGVYLQNLTGQDQEKAGFTAVKFLDQRGALVDPATHQISSTHLEQQARLLEAISAGTRGRVGPDQLLAFQQYARLAGSTLSDQGLINLAPVIAASGSPSSLGTQLSSLQQQLRGGVMTQAGASWLENLGLMDASKVHVGRGGHLTLDRGALVGGDQLQSDPVGWVRDHLTTALSSHGFTDTEAQAGELLRSHLRGTVIGLLGEILRNQPAFARDAQNIGQAAGVDQYSAQQQTDPVSHLNDLTTAVSNFGKALGAPMVSDATGVLGRMAVSITHLTDEVRAHPRAVAYIELITVALGGLLVVGGSLAVAGAALGPLVTGVTALGAVLGGASVAAAIPAMAAFTAGLAPLAAVLASVGVGLGIAHVAKNLDHKYGYDDPNHPITWADKLDPFQFFHHKDRGSPVLPPIFDGRTLPPQTPHERDIQSVRNDIGQVWNSPTYNIHTDVHLDGKTIARHTQHLTAEQMHRQSAQERRATSGGADGLGTSQVPGAAWGH